MHNVLDKSPSNVKSFILGIKIVFTLDCKKKPKNAKSQTVFSKPMVIHNTPKSPNMA